MKFAAVLLVGLLAGFTPLTYALPFQASLPSELGSPDDGLLRAIICCPLEPSLPRPSTRDDLLETLASVEEEDDVPDAEVGGLVSLLALERQHTPRLGMASSPWRQESGSFRHLPFSQLRC